MKFWDASAIVPLLVAEAATPRMQELASEDPVMLVWWGSGIECVSALARAERANARTSRAIKVAFERLAGLSGEWHEVDPNDFVRETAARFLRVHPLRAADALQLGAAFVASDRRPASLELITLDDQLAIAARKEGFVVIDG
jgi:predicted nucleic acid-binding protein